MPLKKLLLTLLLPLWWFTAAKAQTPAAPPAPYATDVKINYVREWTPTAPITDAAIVPTSPVEEVKTTTGYLDGLGRPLQSVSKQASPNKKDVVSAAVYDNLGRETYKYLPFTATSTGAGELIDNGAFKLNPFQQQAAFMAAQYGTQGETFFYSQTDYEPSPLNRPVKSFAPGNSWVGSRGSGSEKATQIQYSYNNVNDAVINWSIAPAQGSLPSPFGGAGGGLYLPGQLQKTTAINEHGKQVVEFKDKEGNVVLKSVQVANDVANIPPSGGQGAWLCTYYVYDDFNQLRFVLSPKATQAYLAGTAITTLADGLCYRYEYDSRHRMIIKKVPDAAEVYMVYDARDRLVMMQDGNLRATNKWLVTVYDVLNRPMQTGLLTNTTAFATHQTNAASSTAYPSITTGFEQLSQNYYDDYTWVAATGTTLTATIDAAQLTNSSYFITTYNAAPYYALPLVANYDIKGMPTGSKVKILNSSPVAYLYSVLFYDEKGRPIQTQTINATGGKDVATTQYDFSGKPLRSLLQHTMVSPPSGGAGGGTQTHTILTKMEYDHLGRVLNAKKQITGIVGGQTITSPEKTILRNTYDELGQLKTKKIGNAPTGVKELETLSYDYNIRGWLLGVNRHYLSGAAPPSGAGGLPYFGFELAYDKTPSSIPGQAYAAAQFNGNIAGTAWKSKGDAVNRQYDYGYDNVNRLLKADFNQVNTNGSFNNSEVNFNLIMGNGADPTTAYDANGNIKQLQQWGLKINTSTQIDNLAYNYIANSNKLLNVIDAIPSPLGGGAGGGLGDFRASALYQTAVPTKTAATIDYTYDVNGNMVKDLNKDIASATNGNGIVYNFLNLPQTITVKKTATTLKGTITYTYDATGNKLQKQTAETGASVLLPGSTTPLTSNITTITNYVSGFVYETKTYSNATANTALGFTDKLQLAAHEEGRIRLNPLPQGGLGWAFDYMLKDHLGNVRMVLTDQAQTDIYPAATLENVTFNGGTAVSVEDDFYTVTAANVVTQATAGGIPLYQNNNGFTNNNPYSNTTANSARLYRLNAATNTIPNKTGLGIVLKVMAGDNLNIFGKSYHKKPAAGYTLAANALSINDVIGLFTGNPLVAGKGASTAIITGQSSFPTNVTALLQNQPPQNTNLPRASINWIVFDDQFKYVTGGFDMVGTATSTAGTFKDHNSIPNINIPKNGYIYIYCSNESQYPVFFDNIQVIHNRSQILEESHFNSWGMRLEGICSKAATTIDNKYQYNGKELQSKEFNDGSGLEEYDYGARHYNAQIGRWFNVDLLADKYNSTSPFVYCLNNPLIYIDPDGQRIIFVHGYLGFGSPAGGSTYWNGQNSSFVNGAKDFFLDNDTYFTNVNYSLTSSAFDRQNDGYNYAEERYEELTKGLDKNKDVFEFVTHSMGGSFAEGMIGYLKGKGWNVSVTVHLNAFQAADITANTDPRNDPNSDSPIDPELYGLTPVIIDYQNTNDPVINNMLRSSPGDIKNATYKIREKSKNSTSQIHRTPIDNSNFWKELHSKLNPSQETSAFNNSGKSLAAYLTDFFGGIPWINTNSQENGKRSDDGGEKKWQKWGIY